MKISTILRLISLVMLIVGLMFSAVIFSNPDLNTTIYVGSTPIDAAAWKLIYIVYGAIIAGLFIISFFVKKKL